MLAVWRTSNGMKAPQQEPLKWGDCHVGHASNMKKREPQSPKSAEVVSLVYVIMYLLKISLN